MKANTEIIIGPPGTGKTTRLLDIMEQELKRVDPNRIAFVSFTKKAAEEASKRACDRFSFANSDLVYFRTIHSMAFMCQRLKRSDTMQHSDYKKIGQHLGITFGTKNDFVLDGPSMGKDIGDQYKFIDGFSKARHVSARSVWDMINHDGLNWYEYRRYVDTVAEYKRRYNKHEFSDMLMMNSEVDVDVLIVDEAQDLSTAQWHFITNTFKTAKRVYIGGDDDQAIYEWSGADVDHFINLGGRKTVLDISYRVPQSVHNLASSITSKIKHRTEKEYHSRKEQGTVDYWMSPDDIDMSSGTWMLLARNSYLLAELAATVRRSGYAYTVKGSSSVKSDDIKAIEIWEKHRKGATLDDKALIHLSEYTSDTKQDKVWHEAFDRMSVETIEYYMSLRRRNESLIKAPRISIGTIHGSKGGEADNVVLVTDMAYSTWDATSMNQDAEHRVWYVGATRAKNSLHIVMPRGRYHYEI